MRVAEGPQPLVLATHLALSDPRGCGLDTVELLPYGLAERQSGIRIFPPYPKDFRLGGPHAAGYHDVHVGRQADDPEGKPGHSGAGRLPLPILRASWKTQSRERSTPPPRLFPSPPPA